MPAGTLDEAAHFLREAARAACLPLPPGEGRGEGAAAVAAVAVVMDGDADGLAGGRLVCAAVERLGGQVLPIFPGKAEHAYSPAVVERIERVRPVAIALVDTGAARGPRLPAPVMVIDHHRPLGGERPACDVYVTSADDTPPQATSALLAGRVAASALGGGGGGGDLAETLPADLDWLPLLGAMGDLGDEATRAFPELAALAKRHTKAQTKKAVALVNAARRSSGCDVALAYRVVARAKGPREVADGTVEEADRLAGYHAEVQAALKAVRAGPRFAGDTALVAVSSPCLVHGMLASRWTRTLEKQRVLVAYRGYLPGEVVFALRTRRDEDLISWLAKAAEGLDLVGTIGFGQPQATGGRLSLRSFNDLVTAIGFDPAAVSP